MVVTRNAQRKESAKKLRSSIARNTNLKSKIKGKKLSKKKAENFISVKQEIEGTTEGLKVKGTVKSAKKNLIKEVTSKATNAVSRKCEKEGVSENETALTDCIREKHAHAKTNTEKTKKAQPRAGSLKKESKDEEKKEIVTVSKRILKRKRSANESTENVENKLQRASSKRLSVKSTKRVKLRKTKRRKCADESEEIVDDFNLKDLSKEHILQCITAIFHLTKEDLKKKNALFEDEAHPVFLQVTCIRVPKTPRRQMRILLPHSVVTPNDDIALIVPDLQRGRRKDYEPTIEHYEELLRKHGCTRIKSIIPMNQVKTEYDQFELKRKLVSSYDHFLVDGRIAGHVSHLLGKEFYRRRKLPTTVRMDSKDLKHEIEHVLRKTTMQLHSFGDTHIVQIGQTSMKKNAILKNVLATCSYLSKNYPGGWGNIRSARIKTATSLGLPIYTTLKNKNSVNIPVVQPKRPKAYHDVKGDLSTVTRDFMVTVTPEGDVEVEKKEKLKKSDA